MTNSKVAFLVLTTVFALQGCAHSELEKEVDNKVAQEKTVKTRADLRAEAGQLIQSAPGLTNDQRTKLSALRDSTRAQDDEMRTQSVKLRAVLIKDLISTNYNDDEVELIKERIKKLEDNRLNLTFNTIEQANTILGHETSENRQRIMDTFFEGRGSH